MSQRREQLASTTVASLDWVWGTAFRSWLTSEKGLFWIHGKPGSGKSTLVHFLSTSSKTQAYLSKSGNSWLLFEFYFDFRAGLGIANSPLGMLRSLLFQLVERCEPISEFVRNQHSHAIAGAWRNNPSEVLKTLCLALESAKLAMCFFIDGLDEYNGKLSDLIKCLLQIQKRGRLKMCLASRPEPIISRMLAEAPAIQMQDHNSTTIQHYIESACQAMLTENEASSLESLWQNVTTEANGVILWARFVVDELIERCVEGATTAELQVILDTFPKEIEDVYARILDKIPTGSSKQRLHAAIAFYVLEHGRSVFATGGDFPTYEFFISWAMIVESLDNSMHFDTKFDQTRFRARIHALLGGLLEFSADSTTVRYVHKTLKTYLERSHALEQEINEIPQSVFSGGDASQPLGEQLFVQILREAAEQLNDTSISMTERDKQTMNFDLEPLLAKHSTSTVDRRVSDINERRSLIIEFWQKCQLQGHLVVRLDFLASALKRFLDGSSTGREELFWSVVGLPIFRLHALFCDNGYCWQFDSHFPWGSKNHAHWLGTWHLRYLLYHKHYSVLEYGLDKLHSGLRKESAVRLYSALIAVVQDDTKTTGKLDSGHQLTKILSKYKDGREAIQQYFDPHRSRSLGISR